MKKLLYVRGQLLTTGILQKKRIKSVTNHGQKDLTNTKQNVKFFVSHLFFYDTYFEHECGRCLIFVVSVKQIVS